MFSKIIPSGTVKFLIGWALVFLVRLLPFRAPNVEPVMTTLMPFAKRYGMISAFTFGFTSIAAFDLVVGQIGIWTLITAVAYGLVGIGAHVFLRNRPSESQNYLVYAIVGTIAYDALTGLTIGPVFYAQPFVEAFVGQIPFTILHLLGNCIFAALVSPVIYRWVVANPKLDTLALVRSVQGEPAAAS